jgi:hypothetical protein
VLKGVRRGIASRPRGGAPASPGPHQFPSGLEIGSPSARTASRPRRYPNGLSSSRPRISQSRTSPRRRPSWRTASQLARSSETPRSSRSNGERNLAREGLTARSSPPPRRTQHVKASRSRASCSQACSAVGNISSRFRGARTSERTGTTLLAVTRKWALNESDLRPSAWAFWAASGPPGLEGARDWGCRGGGLRACRGAQWLAGL